MKTLHRPCPVCGSSQARVLHRQRFALPAGHPLPREFDIVACPKCDFVFADTEANAVAYDRYYAEYSKYADQSTSTGGGGDTRDQARIEATAAEIACYLPDRKARILDIGCANGGMLAALRALGYGNLLGIDPSPECVANTQFLFGIPALQGWLGALPAEAAPADLIILSHVLEHVLDLGDAVARARSLLAPGGMLYVEVPDAVRYSECLAAPFQDFNTEHINHFGQASLENLFTSRDFTLVYEGTKSLNLPGGFSYPACFGFFLRTDTVRSGSVEAKWRLAPELIAGIGGYISRSTAMLAGIDARLSDMLRCPVIVWGTGQLTLKLLVETQLGSADIVAFTDGNPLHHGKILQGHPIVAPDFLRQLPPHPIIICSLLHHAAISDRIRGELALPNPVVTLA